MATQPIITHWAKIYQKCPYSDVHNFFYSVFFCSDFFIWTYYHKSLQKIYGLIDLSLTTEMLFPKNCQSQGVFLVKMTRKCPLEGERYMKISPK